MSSSPKTTQPAEAVSAAEYEHLITSAEAAALVGLAPITLAKMRIRGDGPPYFKLGKAVRYSPSVVLAWARSRTHRSTAEATMAAQREEVA